MDGFFGLFGNDPNSAGRPICGGRTESWDPEAPKEIKSKNIIEFSTHFFSYNGFYSQDDFYEIKVNKVADTGEFKLSCKFGDFKTDEGFLSGIQEIIDKYHLVSENGHYEQVAGLAPQYQPYPFKAVYDSGEELYFATVGNPATSWCADIKKLLCKELLKHGVEDMLPPKADRNVVRFDLKLFDWPRNIKYHNIYLEDDVFGERCFHYMKYIWNKETCQNECDRIITVDEAFFEHISELIEKTGLRDYCNGQIDYPDGMDYNTCREPVIGFCAEGESGKQFNTFVVGEDISDGLKEAAGVIRDYIESVFDNYTGEERSLSNCNR